jgi:hypothetical protein
MLLTLSHVFWKLISVPKDGLDVSLDPFICTSQHGMLIHFLFSDLHHYSSAGSTGWVAEPPLLGLSDQGFCPDLW